MSKLLSFWDENGSYVFFASLLQRPGHALRNRMLARKLGVRQISIGSRSFLRGLKNMTIDEDLRAAEGLWMEAVTSFNGEPFTPKLVVGKHVRISRWTHIGCTNSVVLGNHVLLGSKVVIVDHNHGLFGEGATSPSIPPEQRPLERNRFVKIEDNVWLGDGVVVCPGVTIGQGSVIGANAVVTTDIPPFTLAVGMPARPIRRYDPAQQAWARL